MDEARCQVVMGEGLTHWYCGLPLVQDGACQTCGQAEDIHWPHHAMSESSPTHPYVPSSARCPVHGVPATPEEVSRGE